MGCKPRSIVHHELLYHCTSRSVTEVSAFYLLFCASYICVRLLVPWRRYEFHVYAVMMQRVRILMSALNWAWSHEGTTHCDLSKLRARHTKRHMNEGTAQKGPHSVAQVRAPARGAPAAHTAPRACRDDARSTVLPAAAPTRGTVRSYVARGRGRHHPHRSPNTKTARGVGSSPLAPRKHYVNHSATLCDRRPAEGTPGYRRAWVDGARASWPHPKRQADESRPPWALLPTSAVRERVTATPHRTASAPFAHRHATALVARGKSRSRTGHKVEKKGKTVDVLFVC